MDDDLIACARLVERGDPDRFAAAMAAPLAARMRLFPLYAFNLEVARAPWVTQESMIAEMRLQWWLDALEEIALGGQVRRHEVVTPLKGVLDATGATLLQAGIEARRWDIYRDPFEDAAALEAYLEATSGTLMQAAARCLGAGDLQAAQDLGFAQGVAAYLRAVPALEAKGRIPLVDGRPEGVRALAASGLERLARVGRVPRLWRPAALAAWQTRPLLRLARAEPGRVAEGTLQLSEARRRARLIRVALTGAL